MRGLSREIPSYATPRSTPFTVYAIVPFDMSMVTPIVSSVCTYFPSPFLGPYALLLCLLGGGEGPRVQGVAVAVEVPPALVVVVVLLLVDPVHGRLLLLLLAIREIPQRMNGISSFTRVIWSTSLPVIFT